MTIYEKIEQPTMRNAIAYYRVSTDKQGESKLGLEAQQDAVSRYASANNVQVLKEFTEVESGKKHTNRPLLLQALNYCSSHKTILIIAKLDRLARNVFFIASLIERKVAFVAADRPDADKSMIYMEAIFAEIERDKNSTRTREALQVAKKKGVILGKHGKVLAAKNKEAADGFAIQLQPMIEKFRKRGITSVRAIEKELNRRKVPTFHNCGRWHTKSVHNLLVRVKSLSP
jgi:DNA invertase Pin-like site-specific DNA recombinase